jgi:peptidoglycan/LPS O-acetylase OafA/YrhL
MTGSRYIGFDLMRTTAVMLVLLSHSLAFLPFAWPREYLYNFMGFAGVEIFFVLSGFLIGNIMYKAFQKKFDKNGLKVFWVRRWFRTLPLYYIVLALNVVLTVMIEGIQHVPLTAFLFPLFLQNFMWPHPYFFVPAWSLTIEEYFYLLFPLLLFFFMNIRRIPFRKSFLLMIILFFAIPLILRTAAFILLDSGYIQQSRPGFNPHWDLHLRRITLFRLDAIAMGVFTAYLMNNYKSFLQKYKGVLLLASITLLTASIWMYFRFVHPDQINIVSAILIFPLFSVGFALSMPWLQYMKTMGIFSAPITFISKISYSVYLLHTVLSDFLFKYIYKDSYGLPYQLLIWLAFILVSIGISALSYKYIELPFTQRREKYGSESATPLPVAEVVRK